MKPVRGRLSGAALAVSEGEALLLTAVPERLFGRGIAPPQEARGFRITLDRAEPWGGGRIEGRVEASAGRNGERPVTASVSCLAAWLDLAPQLVGKKSFFRLDTYWELRTRFPVWLDEEAWTEQQELGDFESANWHAFQFTLPTELPRALEGTFVAFRYRVEARRRRRIGHETASVPLILEEPRTIPTVRVETSPIADWRLLEQRSSDERDGSAGRCSVAYEQRREDGATEE